MGCYQDGVQLGNYHACIVWEELKVSHKSMAEKQVSLIVINSSCQLVLPIVEIKRISKK